MHALFYGEDATHITALEDSIKLVTGYQLLLKDTSRRFAVAEIFTNKSNDEITVNIARTTITANPEIRAVTIRGAYEDLLKIYSGFIVPATVLKQELIQKLHHAPDREIETGDRKIIISFKQYTNNVWELRSSGVW